MTASLRGSSQDDPYHGATVIGSREFSLGIWATNHYLSPRNPRTEDPMTDFRTLTTVFLSLLMTCTMACGDDAGSGNQFPTEDTAEDGRPRPDAGDTDLGTADSGTDSQTDSGGADLAQDTGQDGSDDAGEDAADGGDDGGETEDATDAGDAEQDVADASGDAGGDSGDMGSDSGDTGSDSGDTGSDSGDTGSDSADGGTDTADTTTDLGDLGSRPVVTEIDYPVLAHGGGATILGANLNSGTATVTIGGVEVTAAVESETEIFISPLADEVPVGTQDLIVTNDNGTSPAFSITVIHLVINELDADTPGSDTAEFIEISAGLAQSVDLTGYSLVIFNGGLTGDPSVSGRVFYKTDLGAGGATSAAGFLVLGNSSLTPDITFPDGDLEQGEDAAVIFQAPVSDFAGTPPIGDLTLPFIIDALVWESNEDDDRTALYDLMDTLDAEPVVDEGEDSPTRESVSIARCADDADRRDYTAWTTVTPSPGVANTSCD